MTSFTQRIRGLTACLAILALVIAFPIVLIAIGYAPWDADLVKFRRMLGRPDDGSLALAAFAVVGWGAWVVMAGSVVLAVVGEIRRVPAPHVPGFSAPQVLAARLVSVAALLFVAAPTIAVAAPTPPAHSAPVVASAEPEPAAASAMPAQAAEAPEADAERTGSYSVARGDSLWRIAERLLGDGARYTELVALNADVLNGHPDFITPGTILRVPAEAHAHETVVVERGDTLSEIAAEELGDADRYPEIFEASRATTQPDGHRLTDPDLIRPGWRLTVPTGDVQPEPEPEVDGQESESPAESTQQMPDHSTPAPPIVEEEEPAPTAEPAADSVDQADGAGLPGWALPGLAGVGLLAGAVLIVTRAHRRTQLRYRRPGQMLAPAPPALSDVDKTVQVYGAQRALNIEGLDAALSTLAPESSGIERTAPPLRAVMLKGGVATAHFVGPTDLPAPWRGEGTEWQVSLADCEADDDKLPPYPLLVSVGEDRDGALWMVDLESIGSVAITGDETTGLALARHLAAELALNPWAVLAQTDAFGLGAELADLDTLHLRTHGRDDEAADAIVKELVDIAEHGWEYPDPFQVVLTSRPEIAAAVHGAILQSSCRLGAATVAFSCDPIADTTVFEVSADGALSVPSIDLTLVASGLTAEEANVCAAIVDVTRVTPTVDIPLFAQAADGWRSATDMAGALRSELTEGRPTDEAAPRSLLPEPTDEYVDAGATTATDVETLAPAAKDGVAAEIEALDPTLDDDVADWFASEPELPHLALLGPVHVTAKGDTTEIAKRRAYFEELVAYLALHPEGVTARIIGDAFNLSMSRIRTDIGFIRDWLANNPRTGRLHLPKQRNRPPEVVSGYHVEDLLVDADLFRRLRARAQSRGAEGKPDLVLALRLVSGKPFDHLRSQGWSWLLDDEPTYDALACAIVDTAHVVVLDGLHSGDLTQAREAAETACKASPYDEVSRLDLIKVLEADGHPEAAQQMLSEDVFNRRDDAQPPIDLPKRTKDVAAKSGWGRRGQAKGTPTRPQAS